jgi:hypothetical protein
MKSDRLHMRLNRDLKSWLNSYARQVNRKMSEVVEELIAALRQEVDDGNRTDT